MILTTELKELQLEKAIYDEEGEFYIGYCPLLQRTVLIASKGLFFSYPRYYNLPSEDLQFYKASRKSFIIKHREELGGSFTQQFLGSSNLRDYDGIENFEELLPYNKDVTFKCHELIDGYLFARLSYGEKDLLIPPIVMTGSVNDTLEFPLREYCELQYDKNETPICYGIKIPANLSYEEFNQKIETMI